MKEKTSALHSKYIIDGVSRRLTPAEMLDDCLASAEVKPNTESGEFEPIVDESTDPSPSIKKFLNQNVQGYLATVVSLLEEPRPFPAAYADPYTRGRIAKALLDAVWLNGRFKLGDLTIAAKWRWNCKPLGNMAAFYSSAEATADYINNLGICLSGYSFTESGRVCQTSFKVGACEKAESPDEDDIFLPEDAPFGSEHPVLGRRRAVPDKLAADPDSWIIYVPFDTCDFRLGGSLLCDALGQNGDNFPEIGDADYFIDCYEVIREFIEDRIAVSAATVCDGGLLTALKLMCSGDVGADIDISGIMSAYGEDKKLRILFSEVPGAIIQIKDSDYDYVDAEFLLQDIAYYPIGHPVTGTGEVNVKAGGSGIAGILQSLLGSQASEGED
uniref:hypothetical protein n=1 Tax=Candidatus Cryptobacteroides bacterium TaxID=3085639 RepID=UPI004028AB1D